MAAQFPIGADISGKRETSTDDTFKANSLDTLFIYPTKSDYAEAAKSTQLQEYLEEAGYPSVFIITGMKIAREPSVTLRRGKKSGGQGQLGFEMGDGSNIGLRGGGSNTRNTSQTMAKASDMTLAIRVRKLSYRKKYLVFGQRQWSDSAHSRRAELVGEDRSRASSGPEPEFEIDELEFGDEDPQGTSIEEET
jgi:hypothetical protein